MTTIDAAIEKYLVDSPEFEFNEEYYSNVVQYIAYEYLPTNKPFETELGTVTIVGHLSDPNDRDNVHVVVKLDNDNGTTYYRADGYYSSWEGSDWGDAEFYEVKPVEVTNTEYRRV
jgi:hypothetical protein